ncbi:MAG: molybdenum cofactor guanylyltransferase [Ilumatobacteraceae bacterium]
MPRPLVVGAVLCGGASTRMGRDKALLPVDGVAMAAHVAAALRGGGCDEVVAIGGDAVGLAAVGLTVVPDEFPGDGPLGGVITALAAHPDASMVVIVACDLPRLQPSSVAALLAALPGHEVAVATGDAGRPQPVCAAWQPSAVAALRPAFVAGERRMMQAIGLLVQVTVPVPAQDLANVNTPSDLRE